MQPWTPGFPVGQLKAHILKAYAGHIGYSSLDYDVEMNRYLQPGVTAEQMAASVKYLPVATALELKSNFLDRGLPVCFTVGYPGHAVAYIAHGDTLYVFDTQKSETTANEPSLTHMIISQLFQKQFQFVDVLASYPQLQIQTEDDNLCVMWMLFILECVGYMQVNYKVFDLNMILQLIGISASKAGDSLSFIQQVTSKYQRGVSAITGSGRRRKTYKKKIRRVRKICKCSPDVGDCPKCKKKRRTYKK